MKNDIRDNKYLIRELRSLRSSLSSTKTLISKLNRDLETQEDKEEGLKELISHLEFLNLHE